MASKNSEPGKRRRNGGSARGSRGRSGAPIAALDLGTNNCRLLIARPAEDGYDVVDGFSRIVRLGESVIETGMLSDAAMTRTIDALGVCADKIRRRGVAKARCVATEAARRAKNCDAFLKRVHRETGLDLEIISSREEAGLTLAGCLPLLDHQIEHALVFDVGGGSAEIIWLRLEEDRAPDILAWVSLPCGVVTLTEQHGGNDFTPDEYAAVVAKVERMLAPFDRRHKIRSRMVNGSAQMLGTAGTVTTIAGVHLGLQRYNRSLVDGSYLSFDAVRTISHNLSRSSIQDRAAHPCIGPGRADLVVAGCAVLEGICRTWPTEQLRVADRGVREGILMSLMEGDDGARDAMAACQSRRAGPSAVL